MICCAIPSRTARSATADSPGEMVIGIERAIEYYSSFAELRPGDVFHMGAMQVDGMRMLPENSFGPENCVEVGIEKVGDLRVQFIWPYKNDWRPEDDPTRAIHPRTPSATCMRTVRTSCPGRRLLTRMLCGISGSATATMRPPRKMKA